ncbi:hypothetical protein JXM67_06910 [candidate division WOR-3 bacterium]|nr:hypothetical protein [candidate division WOR-3 bacterium]
MIAAILLLVSILEYEAEKMEILKEDQSRVIHLIGGVHLFDDKIDIMGSQAWFAPTKHSLVVKDSLVIRAPDDVNITGDSLYFDTQKRISYIYRRVVATRGSTRITGPELVIKHRPQEAYIPFGAQIHDLEEGIVIVGEEVTYSLKEDRGSIMKLPVLTDDSDSSDFRVTSERMHLDQGRHAASAAGNARVFTEDAIVNCDSLVLFYNEDRGLGIGNTSIVSPEGKIESDSADFKLQGRKLNEIFLYPSVTTRYRTEDQDSVVVNSVYLTIDLSEKDHETLIFTGGCSGTYYWREEETNQD